MRIFSDKNKQKFLDEITESDWSAVYNQNEVYLDYDNFIDIIEQSYERCFQLRKVSRKRF